MISLEVGLGVFMQLLQSSWPALVQGDQVAQHWVQSEVDIWGEQVVQKGVNAFGVCGAADQVADFGPQAGGCGRALLCIIIAAGAKGQHALEGLVGPQQTAFMDSQGTRVVQENASVLQGFQAHGQNPSIP